MLFGALVGFLWGGGLKVGLDAFDRMDFAVFLWDAILNRDSFQLILNVFEDRTDRENLIARLTAVRMRMDRAPTWRWGARGGLGGGAEKEYAPRGVRMRRWGVSFGNCVVPYQCSRRAPLLLSAAATCVNS